MFKSIEIFASAPSYLLTANFRSLSKLFIILSFFSLSSYFFGSNLIKYASSLFHFVLYTFPIKLSIHFSLLLKLYILSFSFKSLYEYLIFQNNLLLYSKSSSKFISITSSALYFSFSANFLLQNLIILLSLITTI